MGKAGIGHHHEQILRNCIRRVNTLCVGDPTIDWNERVIAEYKADVDSFKSRKELISYLVDAYKEVGLLGSTEKLSDKWVLITLRPEDGATSLSNFIYDVNTLLGKNMFLKKEWCYEQTGKTEEEQGKGFHCHILATVKNYVNVADIVKATGFIRYNCLTQIGSKNGKKFLHDERDLQFCKNYIRGEKHNTEKDLSVCIDKIWRKQNGLKDIYSPESRPTGL